MSNIVNFGPADIKFDAVSIGATTEGGSISPSVRVFEFMDILGYLFHDEELTGGEGVINFFEWNEDLEMSDSINLTDWGILLIISPKMSIRLWHCKLFLDFDTEFGGLNHNPFKVKFVFGKDSNGKIISIKEVL